MRAMPFQIEMSLPTWATSTSTAKLPICSRMILEISSALMSMYAFAVAAGCWSRPVRQLFARGAGCPVHSRLLTPGTEPLHASFDLFFEAFQLAHDARVVDGA